MKNVTVEAAQSITALKDGSVCIHTAFNLQRIAGVIGRRERGAFPFLPASILIPFNTCRRQGIWSTWGSPSPCEICSCQIPERYVLMEL